MKQNESQKAGNEQYGRAVMSWSAPEVREVDRGPAWALVGAVVAIMMIVWGIFMNNLLFSFIIVLLSGLYYVTYRQKPKRIEVALTVNGIRMGNIFHAYQNIHTFWILYHPEIRVKRLHIQLKSGFFRNVECELEEQDPSEIRMFLSAHIPESENRTEELMDKISRLLRL